MTTSEILQLSVSTSVQADVRETYNSNKANQTKRFDYLQFICHLLRSWTCNLQNFKAAGPITHIQTRLTKMQFRTLL